VDSAGMVAEQLVDMVAGMVADMAVDELALEVGLRLQAKDKVKVL